MTDSGLGGPQGVRFERGQRVRLSGGRGVEIVEAAIPRADVGWDLFIVDASNPGGYRMESFSEAEAERILVIAEDGAASPERVIVGLWAEWMLDSARSARSTVLASVPLRPFPHQMEAVYDRMLPQPLLRFLLADEPGTGKTIMSGLWLRESQRLGRVQALPGGLPRPPRHQVAGRFRAVFRRRPAGSDSGHDLPAGTRWV